jgi:arylamine N-acetyltransferase
MMSSLIHPSTEPSSRTAGAILSGDSVPPGLLNPFLHTAAAKGFHGHFGIASKKADIHYLKEILHHFSKFPYENLSKIIKHSRETEMLRKLRFPVEVMEGYVQNRLGGTCFSLTFFLETVLVHNGYRCYPVMADMKWSANSHCAVIVFLDDAKFLVDPGYLLNQPMRLADERPRVFDSEFTGVELVRRPDTGFCEVHTFNRTEMKWRYRFRDVPCPPDEFLRHWISSFSWNSMHGLCLTRTDRGRLIYIHKQFMRESSYSGKRNFNIKNDYHARIHAAFGIEPVTVERALSALEFNMARERELGLWKPKEKRNGTRMGTEKTDDHG